MTDAPTGQQIVDEGKKAVAGGSYYTYGGNPYAGSGWAQFMSDCSGLVDRVFANLGNKLPGRPTTYDLVKMGTDEGTSLKNAVAGDLIFFNNNEHVAIYNGDGTVTEDPTTGQQVKVTSLSGLDNGGEGAISAIRRLSNGTGTPSTAQATAAQSSDSGSLSSNPLVATGQVAGKVASAFSSQSFWERVLVLVVGFFILFIAIDMLTKGGGVGSTPVAGPSSPVESAQRGAGTTMEQAHQNYLNKPERTDLARPRGGAGRGKSKVKSAAEVAAVA